LPAVHEIAYPRLKHSISNEELHESYTPSSDELALADEASKGTGPKICLLVLLKVFQRLGYFVRLRDVPKPIAEHISLLFGVHYGAIEWEAYDESGTRKRHVALIREYLNVRPFDKSAQKMAQAALQSAAETRGTLSANVLDNGWYVNIHCQTHLPKGYNLSTSLRRSLSTGAHSPPPEL
jgi:hypothetical protein